MAYFVGVLFGQIIGAAIGALIGALFLQIATNIVSKFKPQYGMAYKAAFLGYASSFVVGLLFGFIVGVTGNEFGVGAIVASGVIGFFVASSIYSIVLKHPEKGPIGFGTACLVSVIQLVFSVIIFGGIGLIAYAIMA